MMRAFLVVVLFADMQLLPPWELRKCPVEQYACYNFEQAKKLMILDSELKLRLLDCDVCEKTKKELEGINRSQVEIIEKLEENVSVLTVLFNERKAMSEQQALEIQKLEKYNVFGKALPWVISALVVSATGGFVLGWMLHR